VEDDPYEIHRHNEAAHAHLQEIMADYRHNMNSVNNRLALPPQRPALPNLSEIKVPTLVVVGEYDIPDVHAHAGAIAVGISGAQRVILSDCGHLVPLEKPEALAEAITTFFDEADFFGALEQDGVQAAAALYHERRAQDPQAILFTEARLNGLGYEFLYDGDAATAVALFELMVDAYPESANAYDSYGEALLATGDTTGAVTNYQKSLELNPGNTNAVNVLEQLRE
jgi:tetratricopeptide (TPR) repeat protein